MLIGGFKAGPFSGEGRAPKAEACAFVSLLFEIAVDGPDTPSIGAAGCLPRRAAVPVFAWRMIEEGDRPYQSAVYCSRKS
jgi:hypothetical protein